MNVEASERILASLSCDALVLDVGGGASPWWRADWVIDGLAFGQRGALDDRQPTTEDGGRLTSHASHLPSHASRFTSATWVQWDLCERKPWPFADKQFDFASCTHVLEDLRDPVWVCSEMQRVAKAGYIETPSRAMEQSVGVEHPSYAGFYHHRWLVSVEGGVLCFRFKPHSLHSCGGAVVARLSAWQQFNPAHANLCFDWRESFACREVLEFDESAVTNEMCAFAAGVRKTPGLLVRRNEPWRRSLARWWYYLRTGARR